MSRYALIRAGHVAALYDDVEPAARAIVPGEALALIPEGVGVGDAWPPPARRGRPTVGRRVEIRLAPDTYQRATAIAQREGRPIAEVIRRAVIAGLG